MMKRLTMFAAFALAGLQALQAARVDVYPQGFGAGGWKFDVQFMDVMGSPYLLAHGAGMRVVDVVATAEVPKSGSWRKLGEFELSPGSILRIITSESYGTVIADGFALVP